MNTRELERLSDLLRQLHEELGTIGGDGQLRDEISHVRFHVNEQIDAREDERDARGRPTT